MIPSSFCSLDQITGPRGSKRVDTIGPRSAFIQSCYQTPPPHQHQRREAWIITDRHQLSGAPDTSGRKVRKMLKRCRSHVLIKLIQWWIQFISRRQSPSLTGSIETSDFKLKTRHPSTQTPPPGCHVMPVVLTDPSPPPSQGYVASVLHHTSDPNIRDTAQETKTGALLKHGQTPRRWSSSLPVRARPDQFNQQTT